MTPIRQTTHPARRPIDAVHDRAPRWPGFILALAEEKSPYRLRPGSLARLRRP